MPPTIFKQHLIIFTRYPEPGTTKTRLIPALGAVGAAHLQKQMTEYTLSQIQTLRDVINLTVEIRFTGGNLPLMLDWLGVDWIYQSQGTGDLGARMMRSLADAFKLGAEQVVIIGTDCPGINSQILATAFKQMHCYDLILGPAIDGGYYLIGLRQLIPDLFVNIEWGSTQVFAQTIDIAHKLNLLSMYLPPLSDIDYPEDLAIWEQIQKMN